ncbi:(5-formylfuran-3-yl)methyl phosphate synthase [Azospirillum sp. sgz301742]
MSSLVRVAHNRKLLVSVFNAQEAREAVLGGGRIIDSEDPKSALGNISPRNIMDISDAVLDFKRGLDVQLSTNIGEDQLLFRRSQTGQAIEKSRYEIAGKAAQAAIGVALSMGTRVHPVNLVKVGVDGMEVEKVAEVLQEVVLTLRRTEPLSHTQVMSVLFAQDLDLWNERKRSDAVRRVLVELREFNPSSPDDPDSFDISPYAIGTLRDQRTGEPLFTDPGQVSLASLIHRGALPPGSDSTHIRVNELFEHRRYFPRVAAGANRTTRSVIKAMVDVTAESGANAIMIDTSILSKVSNVCLVDTAGEGMVDINGLLERDGLGQRGILSLEDLRFFVDYCHYRGVAANVAGSIESYQAQQLWVLVPELDQASTRGAASAVDHDPSNHRTYADTRQHRVIRRTLVRGLAPPEHGGVLNLPEGLREIDGAAARARDLMALVRDGRRELGLPDLEAFWVDRYGAQTRIERG